jgi:hypothetical protein
MRTISIWYSNDKGLLEEISVALAGQAEAIEEPSELEAPATLNLDLATVARDLWQLLVGDKGEIGGDKGT